MHLPTCLLRAAVAATLFWFFSSQLIFAQSNEAMSVDVPLWEGTAPGANGNDPEDVPMAMVRLPKTNSSMAAIVICPGGGYGGLAMGHEGHEIAQWINDLGMAAIICDYRHRGKGYGHPYPWLDAQRAIRLTRSKARSWNIDPKRIGILGFSAGGHLASTVLTQFDPGDPVSKDPIARQSSKPDFGILCYPVILMGTPETHKGSEVNLLGESPDPKQLDALQSASRVTKETPAVFVFHTSEDKSVLPQNSIEFYAALVKNGVPGELHVFEKGGHGVGLGRTIPGTSEWPNACARWLRNRGILK